MSDPEKRTDAGQWAGVRLEEYLALILPHLSQDLISHRAREHLQELGRVIPVTDLAGFECNLADSNDQVDVITRLPLGGVQVPGRFMVEPTWASIALLAGRLNDPAFSLSRYINVIDLEFDLPSAPPPIPLPGIFFELNRHIDLSAEQVAALANEIWGGRIPDTLAGTLRRCVEALPPGGRILHLGALRSRGGEQLRVVIGRVDPEQMVHYLDEIGWAGNREEVAAAIATFRPLVQQVCLSLDVGREVSERVGIECFIEPNPDPILRWETLLRRLHQEQLCTEAKAQALLAWHGACRKDTCPEPWPPSLKRGDDLLGQTAVSVFARFLSHIKLVSKEKGHLYAKAYLGFAHYWLRHQEESRAIEPEVHS